MAKKTKALRDYSREELIGTIKSLSTIMYVFMGLIAAFVAYMLVVTFQGKLDGRHTIVMMPVGVLLIFFSLIYSRRAAFQKELNNRQE